MPRFGGTSTITLLRARLRSASECDYERQWAMAVTFDIEYWTFDIHNCRSALCPSIPLPLGPCAFPPVTFDLGHLGYVAFGLRGHARGGAVGSTE